MKLLFITDCPDVARYVVSHGVDRVFVDLETLGKQARQGHLDTVISAHSLDKIPAVRDAIGSAELLVRVNPFNSGSQVEVDAVIDRGADILMLPMYRDEDEVRAFVDCVRGRARVVLLAETCGALLNLERCASVPGVDELHIGLNDLSLELGCRFMFEPLATTLIDEAARILRRAGKPFGIGGLARVGEGLLPAEVLVGEHVRLGSTAAILSRTFHRRAKSVSEIRACMDFPREVAGLREAYARFASADAAVLEDNRRDVVSRIKAIAAGLGVAR